jgi:pyruvate/2-oxoglutarate dehydrogenase complex dihydrolipoamide acyltransferase (E2) component
VTSGDGERIGVWNKAMQRVDKEASKEAWETILASFSGRSEEAKAQKVMTLFGNFDDDENSALDFDELQRALSSCGVSMNKRQMKALEEDPSGYLTRHKLLNPRGEEPAQPAPAAPAAKAVAPAAKAEPTKPATAPAAHAPAPPAAQSPAAPAVTPPASAAAVSIPELTTEAFRDSWQAILI